MIGLVVLLLFLWNNEQISADGEKRPPCGDVPMSGKYYQDINVP